MPTKNEIANNKYYVGANSVFHRNWGHDNVADATSHAQELLEDNNHQDYCIIVKIIRVVRRVPVKIPIKIEDLK